MQLVNAIEAELGPLDEWLSYILTIIFAFDSNGPGALVRLQKVIAFLYGNNTPLNLACQFLRPVVSSRVPSSDTTFNTYTTSSPNIPHYPDVGIMILLRDASSTLTAQVPRSPFHWPWVLEGQASLCLPRAFSFRSTSWSTRSTPSTKLYIYDND